MVLAVKPAMWAAIAKRDGPAPSDTSAPLKDCSSNNNPDGAQSTSWAALVGGDNKSHECGRTRTGASKVTASSERSETATPHEDRSSNPPESFQSTSWAALVGGDKKSLALGCRRSQSGSPKVEASGETTGKNLPAWERPAPGVQAPRVPPAIKVACFELSVQAPEFVLPQRMAEPDSRSRAATVMGPAPALSAAATRPRASSETVLQASSGRGKRPHRCTWSVFVDAPTKGSRGTALSLDQFQGRLRHLGDFEALGEFRRQYGSRLETTRNDEALRVFEAGIEPTWEDPANNGIGAGKWTIMCPDKETAKQIFGEVFAAMCPKEGPGMHGINGIVSVRKRGQDMVQLWSRAHKTRTDDPFGVRLMVGRIEGQVGTKLGASFKPHAAKAKKRHKKMLEPVPSMEDSDYEVSPDMCGHPGVLEPHEFTLPAGVAC